MTKQVFTKALEMAIIAICLIVIILLPMIGVAIAFVVMATYILVNKERLSKLKELGFKKPSSWEKTILTTISFALLIQLSFLVLFDPLIERITSSQLDISGVEHVKGNLTNLFIMLGVGWIIGGFLEEILFRGFLLNRLSNVFKSRAMGDAIAIIITCGSFGYSHLYQGLGGMISTGLISAIIAIIYIFSNRNIWYAILTHGFINTFAFILIYFDCIEWLSSLVF
jgi:hypothetical protein